MDTNYEAMKNRIAGALYGVAVGDALGGPLEFMSAEQIKRAFGRVTTMQGGGWLGLRPGETTDDTAMTLAVAEGIMENPRKPIVPIGARFIAWAKSGPKDIGGTCRASIGEAAGLAESFGQKAPTADDWFNASEMVTKRNGNRSGGNGALMRTIYPALYYADAEDAQSIAVAQGDMTHWDEYSREACKLYASVVHYLITETQGKAIAFMDCTLRGTRYDLEEISKDGRDGALNPTGFVVSSLKCALYALWDASADFEEALIYAVNQGGDADTIGAICGGLAGALYGFGAIPKEWVAALSKADRARLDAAVEAAAKNRWAAIQK